MKSITILGAIATAVLMSACVSQSPNTTQSSPQAQTPSAPLPAPTAASTAPDQVFHCKNGMTATVKYNVGEDKIRLFVDTIESSAILSLAPSGSGERYVSANAFYNKPAEFHFKGKDGNLSFQDPYGNKVNTSCRSK